MDVIRLEDCQPAIAILNSFGTYTLCYMPDIKSRKIAWQDEAVAYALAKEALVRDYPNNHTDIEVTHEGCQVTINPDDVLPRHLINGDKKYKEVSFKLLPDFN